MHAIGIGRGIVGIAKAKLAAPRHIAEFVDGPGIRARSAERREVGDNGIGLDHHGFVTAEYLQGGVIGRAVDRTFQRIQPDQPMPRAQRDLAPSDIKGIGQENVGAGEVDLHLIKAAGAPRSCTCPLESIPFGWNHDLVPMASWFETRGVAALLTMRVSDLILRRRKSAVSKDEATERENSLDRPNVRPA